MTLDIDGYSKQGVGLGYDFTIEQADNSMALDLYGMKDSGTQRTDTGLSMEVPKDYRYAALWEQTLKLSQNWTLQGQLSYLSDSTFVSSWREEDYRNRREYETSLYLKNETRNTAFTVLGKYALNDFLSNSWLVGSLGYQVNKLPEVTYQRFGDSLFGDTLTWSSSYNASRMQIVIPDGTPANSGLRADTFQNVGGLPFGPISPSARPPATSGSGRHGSTAFRPVRRSRCRSSGAFNITPFAMGRVIGYFNDETTINSDDSSYQWYGSGGGDDQHRGATRLRRRLQRGVRPPSTPPSDRTLCDAVVRHIELRCRHGPFYDPLLDQLSTGGLVRVGVKNTLQTHRGGPGRWYEVDWLTVDAAVVYSTDKRHQPFPDPAVLRMGAKGTLNSETSSRARTPGSSVTVSPSSARGSTTSTVRSSPADPPASRSTTARDSPPSPSTASSTSPTPSCSFGNYEVSDKYSIGVVPQWDFEREDFRTVQGTVIRSFPDFDFMVYVSYDQVRGETRVGAQLGQVNY